jgi:hypothetical protein
VPAALTGIRRGFVASGKKPLRSFTSYAQQMKGLANFRLMKAADRDELLRDLYRIAARKVRLEKWAATERSEAQELRKWKHFLQHTPLRLRAVLKELIKLAKHIPEVSDVEILFDGEEFRRTLYELVNNVETGMKLAEELEPVVVALINPGERTKVERRIARELVTRYEFPVRESSLALDIWMVKEAAAQLNRYRDRNGKKISDYELIIWNVFKIALGEQNRSVDAIRKHLPNPRRNLR